MGTLKGPFSYGSVPVCTVRSQFLKYKLFICKGTLEDVSITSWSLHGVIHPGMNWMTWCNPWLINHIESCATEINSAFLQRCHMNQLFWRHLTCSVSQRCHILTYSASACAAVKSMFTPTMGLGFISDICSFSSRAPALKLQIDSFRAL